MLSYIRFIGSRAGIWAAHPEQRDDGSEIGRPLQLQSFLQLLVVLDLLMVTGRDFLTISSDDLIQLAVP